LLFLGLGPKQAPVPEGSSGASKAEKAKSKYMYCLISTNRQVKCGTDALVGALYRGEIGSLPTRGRLCHKKSDSTNI
jgi:hypothetical protein